MHTQLVVTPELNDGVHLDRSIADLATLWPAVRSVSVVPVGLTKHHKYGRRPNTRAEAARVFDQVSAWQERLSRELGVRLAYLTDEWYLILEKAIPPTREYDGLELQENGLGMTRRFLDEWLALRPHVYNLRRPPHLTLVTGTLFGKKLAETASEFAQLAGLTADVVPVTNERLGGTITVAGLLMGQDVVDQLRGRDLGDLLVLPRIMFDHPDTIALDGVPPDQIAAALGRPVTLVDGMGDLWKTVKRFNAG